MILHNVMWESRPLPKIVRKAPAARSAGAFSFIYSLPSPSDFFLSHARVFLSFRPPLFSGICPLALSFCLSWGNFTLPSPLPFAFSFRAEHVSLPLLVSLALLLGIVPFDGIGAFSFFRWLAAAARHPGMVASRRGAGDKGLAQPLTPYDPQPRVGAAIRDNL